MRFDIISDTHGYLSPELLDKLQGADIIVHAGDICSRRDIELLEGIAELKYCLGNNDLPSNYSPLAKKIQHFYAAGLRWEISHYRERLDLSCCDIGVFGHTHRSYIATDPTTGVLLVNPGSANFPRDAHASMARIYAEDGHIISSEIIPLS